MSASTAPFQGARLAARPAVVRARRAAVVVHAGRQIKLNTVNETWVKKPLDFTGQSIGILSEQIEVSPNNFLKKMEEKKLLSFVESAGLLSAAEKAGLSLGKLEQLKLLSTAESLGLLSLAESAATTDGATISSLAIPFFVLACASLLAIPDSNIALTVAQDALAAVFLGTSAALLLGGRAINALNE